MHEDEPLPLARMATINKPSFWIFMIVCLALYICNKMLVPDTLAAPVFDLNEIAIIGVAFAGLFLNLVTAATNDKRLNEILTITCYVFEAVSVVVLAFMVLIA